MKVKAYWKSINPFHPDPNQLGYTKTVDVPDDTILDELKDFAEADSRSGYVFDKFEVLKTLFLLIILVSCTLTPENIKSFENTPVYHLPKASSILRIEAVSTGEYLQTWVNGIEADSLFIKNKVDTCFKLPVSLDSINSIAVSCCSEETRVCIYSIELNNINIVRFWNNTIQSDSIELFGAGIFLIRGKSLMEFSKPY